MPQMAPLWWNFLSPFTLSMFTLTLTMIYFFPTAASTKNLNLEEKQTLTFLFKW